MTFLRALKLPREDVAPEMGSLFWLVFQACITKFAEKLCTLN